MKISSAAGPGPTTSPRTGRVAGGEAFAPQAASAAGAAAGPARAAGVGPVGGLDMLLALQAAEGPLERRRRAVRRGERLLDVLDEVKLALLAGVSGDEPLTRLREAASQAAEGGGDQGLDELLGQIDLRAAVELAKGRRPASVGAG